MISRKIAAVALSIFMAFAACACNGGTNSDSTDISSESSESSVVSETSSDNSSEPESHPSAVALQYAEQSDEIAKFYKEISEKKDFPAINITTLDSARISSKTKYVDSVIDVFNCDESYTLSAEGGVKVRGNSSADQGSEKPYRIKFNKKHNMLGLHDGNEYKSWVLLRSCWNLAPDYMGFSLAREIFEGKYYSSDCAYVNLYINRQSKGVYLLCEQNQAGEGRVDVTEPKSGEAPDEIGYLLEMDNYPDGEEHPFFTVDHNIRPFTDISGQKRSFLTKNYTIRSDTTTKAQRDFIKKYVENIFKILFEASDGNLLMMNDNYELVSASGVYSTPKEAVSAVIDTESLANMIILEELVQNYDVGEGSFYLAVDFSDDSIYPKLTFLAPWDFNWGYTENPSGGYYASTFQKKANNIDRSNTWYITAMKQEWFSDIVKAKWAELMERNALTNVTKAVREHTATLAGDLDKDSQRTKKAADLCDYVNKRIKWLDAQWRTTTEQ